MNRLGALVFAALALGLIAMSAVDTKSSDTDKVWHVYAARTPLTP